MIGVISRLIGRTAPALSEARPADAAAIAALHKASFQRGWGEEEVYSLLIDKNVIAHRAVIGRVMAGFILSRLAAGEAEILSIAIAPKQRGRGLSRPLLDLNLRRLAGLGARTVFLEVDENNAPARALYRRAGFADVGRRKSYYQSGANALVLRRDL
ncbi:MAG: ribosomal protein S18-alanine N-acetyltransferase [Xanthobacteraceae bacterium]|jgi:ribosomal-protein-alanine N-acetyltransferase